MQTEHWGSLPAEDDGGQLTPDKYVPTAAKKLKLDEIRQRGDPQPQEKHHKLELRSALVTQTIEVMKQTEVLQSLIETYSNKNGSSNYLLNPCLMIPEVDFPPENAAELVGSQKFQKPIWFTPTVDTAYSRGDPEAYPEIPSSACRQAMRKVMCGMLRLAGFTDCSESAVQLLTDATEEFLRSFIGEYRGYYDSQPRLQNSTVLQLVPLERAHFAQTGTSLTQVHNYYKHKVLARNRAEIAEFNSVLQEYDKLMKESQSSMQKQHNEFNGHDFLNILDNSATGSSQSIGGMAMGDMLQDLGGSTGSSGTVSSQQMLYGLLDGQISSNTSNMTGTSGNGSTGGNGNGNGATISNFHATFET
uniref:SAGA complex subunit Spt7 n=1 Tax=Drosophila melanogaster TaxID=7227 RepID=SPT7_DROME|eukprot:NP_573248.2 Spt7 [Drosophila melanogaster]